MIMLIILGFSFIAIFAFTFFLIALASGLLMFMVGIFKKPSQQVNYHFPPTSSNSHPSEKNDSIIDI